MFAFGPTWYWRSDVERICRTAREQRDLCRIRIIIRECQSIRLHDWLLNCSISEGRSMVMRKVSTVVIELV